VWLRPDGPIRSVLAVPRLQQDRIHAPHTAPPPELEGGAGPSCPLDSKNTAEQWTRGAEWRSGSS